MLNLNLINVHMDCFVVQKASQLKKYESAKEVQSVGNQMASTLSCFQTRTLDAVPLNQISLNTFCVNGDHLQLHVPSELAIPCGTPPRLKKRKGVTSTAACGSKYNPEWQPDVLLVSRGCNDTVYSFYCSLCKKDISCRHQGISDLKRHEKSSSKP